MDRPAALKETNPETATLAAAAEPEIAGHATPAEPHQTRWRHSVATRCKLH
jgi:hypothetical protein